MKLKGLGLAAGIVSMFSCGDHITTPVIDRFSTHQYHCADTDCKKVGSSIQRNTFERPVNFIGHIYKTGINDHYYGYSYTDTITKKDSVFSVKYTFWSEMNRQEGSSYAAFRLSGLESKDVTIVMRAGTDSVVEVVRPRK